MTQALRRGWTYYRGIVEGGPDAVLRRRSGGETQSWDRRNSRWVDVPGDGLAHAIFTGDLGYDRLSPEEAQTLMRCT